jgi:hypothetical protein
MALGRVERPSVGRRQQPLSEKAGLHLAISNSILSTYERMLHLRRNSMSGLWRHTAEEGQPVTSALIRN